MQKGKKVYNPEIVIPSQESMWTPTLKCFPAHLSPAEQCHSLLKTPCAFTEDTGLSALDTHPDSVTLASFNQKELPLPPLSLGTFTGGGVETVVDHFQFYCPSAGPVGGPAIPSQRDSQAVMSRQWLRVNTDTNGFLQFRRAALSPWGLNSHED